MFPNGFAQMQTQRQCRSNTISLFWLLLCILGLVSYACAPTTTTVTSSENTIFRSKDYIVYQLQKSQTPAELAEKFLGGKHKSWMIEEANPGVSFGNGNNIVIPLKNRNKGGLSSNGYQTIPILTYHRFAESCSSPLCMPEKTFDLHMKYLKENGYHAITGDELLAFLEYRQGIPKKSVLITMDDGYRSVYNIAYPILKKYGFTATIFIYTSFVGVSKTAITWNQLKEMKAAGFTIGSHTIDHSDLTNPKEGETEQAFINRIQRELYGSKKIIDQKLEQNTYFLAYPYGYYDQKSIQMAKKAGYKVAMSVKRGGNPFFANPLALRRDQILKRDKQVFITRLKTFKRLSLK
ncbi:MAG: polysaccharide deacetylase family protein [Desulfobacterales bacterium]|jgi:peptidoglycan/xylan/chitin deacetylase (PgdA/CDA1 family)